MSTVISDLIRLGFHSIGSIDEYDIVLCNGNYTIALTTKYGDMDYYCMDDKGNPVSFVMKATRNTMRSGTNYHITETELTGCDLDIGYALLGCGHCGHYVDPVIQQYVNAES